MTTVSATARRIAERRGLLRAGGACDDRELAKALAAEAGLAFVELSEAVPSADALSILPCQVAGRLRALPLEVSEESVLVAVADPFDAESIDALRLAAGREIELCVAPEDELLDAIGRILDKPLGTWTVYEDAAGLEESPEVTASDGPVIRIVESIIAGAVSRRASDVHFEPLEQRLRVRCRIDGALVETESLPGSLRPAVVSRLKIMANISIAERRLPQDGRLKIAVDGREYDLRVATLPTVHGESVVMRVLDKRGVQQGTGDLGMSPADRAAFERIIEAPDGLVLVTGPTGSGKTTTLYAALHRLNRENRKIITVEDPIEYQIAGINQVPVNPLTGMTFAASLRAMLRQAPNVIMVGEIRDGETADIAINAALTGHLVFSTLHTNDAPGAVTRLADIGVKPFLVSTSLRAVIAQRLVRRICPECRRAVAATAAETAILGAGANGGSAPLFRGEGCGECEGTGYRGRAGLFEIFLVNDAARGMIHGNVSAARLRDLARRTGMTTLREDGMSKVLAGITTIEEVVSGTVVDPA